MAQFVCDLEEKVQAVKTHSVTYTKPGLAMLGTKPRLSCSPPKIPAAIQSSWKKKNSQNAQTGRFKQLTVKEALLKGLVAIELWMRFYVSEIIGKTGLTGYNV